jgi:hypothetical protein
MVPKTKEEELEFVKAWVCAFGSYKHKALSVMEVSIGHK